MSGVIVKLDPAGNSTSPQAAVIPIATCKNDGAMSKEQACQLGKLSKGAWSRTIEQPADGDDFVVAIPAALQLGTSSYMVKVTIGTAGIFIGISVDFAGQTASQFRVTTDGDLPNGTILLFSLEKLA